MELPAISASSYCTSVVDPERWGGQLQLNSGHEAGGQLPGAQFLAQQKAALAQGLQLGDSRRLKPLTPEPTKAPPVMPTPVRIVKVFIADIDERLPLNKRILHTGEEQLTDLTDQELFFEVPIAELLKTHNALRMQTIDKKAAAKSDHEVFLEPVRIRDLKMVVVNVASFV